jgi:arsenate reductase
LAIVKHIVQAHRGELKIESVLKKGTTIRVLLPTVATQTNQKTILFFCTGNACRSQMAEGFARQLALKDHEIYSAGTSPKGLHLLAVQVMKEVGIDISGQYSKGLDGIPLDRLNVVVTLCGDAAESCPALPAQPERLHWALRDPALAQGSPEDALKVFREVRDEIRSKVEDWLGSKNTSTRAAGNVGQPNYPSLNH